MINKSREAESKESRDKKTKQSRSQRPKTQKPKTTNEYEERNENQKATQKPNDSEKTEYKKPIGKNAD